MQIGYSIIFHCTCQDVNPGISPALPSSSKGCVLLLQAWDQILGPPIAKGNYAPIDVPQGKR